MARARVYSVQGNSIVTPEGLSYERNPRRKTNRNDERELVDSFERAQKVRKDFYGRTNNLEQVLPFTWPRFVRYVGRTNAEQYLSDKKLAHWEFELFKHLAEDSQYLFINPSITTLLNDRGEPVEFRETGRRMKGPEGGSVPTIFYAQSYEITSPMPKHFAVLAEDKGVQWVTSDGRYWEARIPNCTLAAVPLPPPTVRSQAPIFRPKAKVFLISYSPEGVHYIITGTKLNVTEDGIVH